MAGNTIVSAAMEAWPRWNITQLTWVAWNQTISVTSSSTTTTTYVWENWINTAQMVRHGVGRRVPTQDELRAEKEQADRRAAEWVAQEKRRVAQADAAKRRATDLLMRHLTDQQRADLEQKNCFYLESIAKGGERRRYRIDRGTHGNVKLLDKDGRILGSYCVQPNGVPAEDAMLAQKLWIESDEEAFRKVANFRRAG